jgi:hypothetical protein
MAEGDDKNKQNVTANKTNILFKEIESWKGFAYALREECAMKN